MRANEKTMIEDEMQLDVEEQRQYVKMQRMMKEFQNHSKRDARSLLQVASRAGECRRMGVSMSISRQRHHSSRLRFTAAEPLGPAFAVEKYSSEPLGSAFIVASPSCQLAGQTSPCSSYHLKFELRGKGDKSKRAYGELEGFDETNGLLDRASNRKVINSDLPA